MNDELERHDKSLSARIIKAILNRTLKPFVTWYIRKDRNYTFRGIKLLIPVGVFHPGLFFSTKIFIDFIDKQPVKRKKLLELGAGSGLISIYFANKGAIVSSSDINQKVIETLPENATRNKVKLDVIYSDLFANIPPQKFDYIVIAPPYYPHTPKTEAEMAWYCGEGFEYFKQLFAQLGNYMDESTQTLMILSQDCAIQKIKELAGEQGFSLSLSLKKKALWEWNYIFRVESAK